VTFEEFEEEEEEVQRYQLYESEMKSITIGALAN
jgi:hypothetical protein